VRTPLEFSEVHLEQAINIPLDTLNAKEMAKMRALDKSEPLYIICKSGARGEKACNQLKDAGLHNVVNVDGGTDACVAQGVCVVRGKKNDISGTPDADHCWDIYSDRSGSWISNTRGLLWLVCLCWSRFDFCRNCRLVRNGITPCQDALEPSTNN